MPSKSPISDRQIARRLRLRDLLVFASVAEHKSMAKAAAELGITQPSVSEAIADLEHTYGVPLFDRSPKGVQLTLYGEALLRHSDAIFGEIAQSARDIEHLADPETGELRIACLEGLLTTILPEILLKFVRKYPRVAISIEYLTAPETDLSGLRSRLYDLAILRRDAIAEGVDAEDIKMETLFTDELVVAAGLHSPWLQRDKVALRELADEPWILTPPGYWHRKRVAEAFRLQGLAPPNPRIAVVSVMLRMHLLANGPYISVFGGSVMQLNAPLFGIGAIPVDLPSQPWPIVAVTLKDRTQSPVVQEFIATARHVAETSLGAEGGLSGASLP
ncbi:MAG TPA: LysR family transcriptional regulator [Dongiaceae bacterium]|nr:LysR family transcriptional regulator [Dongiaceae bacterium]